MIHTINICIVLVFVKSTYFLENRIIISLNLNWQSSGRKFEDWLHTYRECKSKVKPKAIEKEKGAIGAVYETAKYPVKFIDYRDENLQRVEDFRKRVKE